MEELKVIYEDNHVIVVIKPQNIPTQEDESKDKDLLTMVKEYIKEKENKPGNVYVGMVHRLDRPTGGVMVFAKTSKAASRLTQEIQEGVLTKNYLAVVNGKPREKRSKLVNYLQKNARTNTVMVVPELTTGAKRAELNYEVIEEKEKVSLVKVELITGRSHQIRVQMKHIGCPIYGDVRYGGDKLAKGHNLALWSYELKFVHPTTKENMTFKVYPNEEITPWNVFNLNAVK
ncbi:MAG: RluA family pseudouridine synthase [Clostridiales bacterium]|nr:RluA family pseudouridine synthase [Clostridiales bacterium]